MQHPFNDLEGLRIAAEMERRGAELYRHAVRISTAPEAIDLLKRLDADETAHQEEFERLYQNQLARRDESGENWYDAESSAYLSAVAADVVFAGGLVELGRNQGFDSPTAILRSAIQAEKDSILFYSELARHSGDPHARRVFETITQQEKSHLLELRQMLREKEEGA